jgi:asparagine synthase (glutamine-hydrolysing)
MELPFGDEIMCGFACAFGQLIDTTLLRSNFDKIQYRGPDNSQYQYFKEGVYLAFHRLAIMDVSDAGNQPLVHPQDSNIILICNGEIYNHEVLTKRYDFEVHSKSDCEVIVHMYKSFGLEKTLKELDGVYAFVLYDKNTGDIHAARDPFGVRPAFWGKDSKNNIYVASEAKCMTELADDVYPFPPGKAYTWALDKLDSYQELIHYRYEYQTRIAPEKDIIISVREHLTKAVQKRLMSHREIGCLLSGGLDSSLIAALVSREIGEPIQTFSIGMEGSIDLEYARKVASHIGSIHHEVLLTQQDFLNAIPEVIFNIESYDTTTVRASVGNYLVSQYIKENTNCTVIFNGDGADEVTCGYIYNRNAPSPMELQKEAVRLLEEIHLFDVLRSDRSISSNGLEPRTPFLDKDFVDYYMGISPQLKRLDQGNLEKYILRKAFEGTGLLPFDVLWRRKCAFSDGVSNRKKSWHHVIQDYVDTMISHEEYDRLLANYKHCVPQLKESLYYRRIFERQFGHRHRKIIPHFWLPRWTDVIDPSARELVGYQE